MSRNGEGSSNRIRGPTSALSSFLREQGIAIPNRSRRTRREETQQEIQAEDTFSEATGLVANTEQEEEEEEIVTVATRSAIKKRKKESDDEDDDDNLMLAGPSSRKAVKGRARILFCNMCKSRFARNMETEEEDICESCKNGKITQPKKVKRKRLNGVKKEPLVSQGKVPSLQDVCIEIVVEYIEEVEAFGIISDDSFEKLSKIICRNRKLNNQTSRLFMEPHRKMLSLYDCTNMDETALMNIAHFCPRAEKIELTYCGQINDKVLSLYQERLHNLNNLHLSGAFLITKEAWMSFFEKTNTRLQSFGTRHSNRFNLECVKSLVTHCPNLQTLDLGQLSQMKTDWLPEIAKLKHLKRLHLAWPSTEEAVKEEDLIDMLTNVGPQLTELSLRGFKDLTDEVLLEGVMHCKQLKKLNLELCDQLTAKSVVHFFDHWETKEGLTHLDLSRCILLDDDVLKAIVQHSGETLTHLNIHSLELLTPNGLEILVGEKRVANCNKLIHLDCGFVRAMDDFVLKKLVTKCKSLQKLLVCGCHLLTNTVQVKDNTTLHIIGRETN